MSASFCRTKFLSLNIAFSLVWRWSSTYRHKGALTLRKSSVFFSFWFERLLIISKWYETQIFKVGFSYLNELLYSSSHLMKPPLKSSKVNVSRTISAASFIFSMQPKRLPLGFTLAWGILLRSKQARVLMAIRHLYCHRRVFLSIRH